MRGASARVRTYLDRLRPSQIRSQKEFLGWMRSEWIPAAHGMFAALAKGDNVAVNEDVIRKGSGAGFFTLDVDPVGAGGPSSVPILPFSIQPARRVQEYLTQDQIDGLEGGEFVVMPSVIASNFDPSQGERIPEASETSLESYPLLQATETEQGVYLRCELTASTGGNWMVEQTGEWEVVLAPADDPPEGQAFWITASGTVTNGIYYRRLGRVSISEGSWSIYQDRVGPWSVEFHHAARSFIVHAPILATFDGSTVDPPAPDLPE